MERIRNFEKSLKIEGFKPWEWHNEKRQMFGDLSFLR
jgi:hypothetical protein